MLCLSLSLSWALSQFRWELACSMAARDTLAGRKEDEPEPEPEVEEKKVAPVVQHPLAEEIKAAAKAGDVAKVEALLDQGVPVDVTDDTGYTPLYHGTMYGKEEVVAACIKHGASVDKENNNGVTPIMAAARDGVTAIVKMLLEAGSDPYVLRCCLLCIYLAALDRSLSDCRSQLDEFGRTPATVAESKGFEETSEFVLDWCDTHPEGSHGSLIIQPPARASNDEPEKEPETQEEEGPKSLSEVLVDLDGAVASTNQWLKGSYDSKHRAIRTYSGQYIDQKIHHLTTFCLSIKRRHASHKSTSWVYFVTYVFPGVGSRVHTYRAITHARMDDLNNALEDLKEGLFLNPRDAIALKFQARLQEAVATGYALPGIDGNDTTGAIHAGQYWNVLSLSFTA